MAACELGRSPILIDNPNLTNVPCEYLNLWNSPKGKANLKTFNPTGEGDWTEENIIDEEDIKERGVLDWLKAHTSLMKALDTTRQAESGEGEGCVRGSRYRERASTH